MISASYCDGCGGDIGQATLADAVQVVAVGTNGRPSVMYLCTKVVYRTDLNPEIDYPGSSTNPGKYTGCAKKVLTRATLGKLYEEVEEYTGDPDLKPFALGTAHEDDK